MSQAVRINALGGVNLLADPTGLEPQESVIMQNLFPNRPGTFGLRKAMGWWRNLLQDNAASTVSYVAFQKDAYLGFQGFSNSTVPGVDKVVIASFSGLSGASLTGNNTAAGDHLWVITNRPESNGANVSSANLVRRSNKPYCIVNVGQRTLVFDGTSTGYVISLRSDSDPTKPYLGSQDASGLEGADVVIQRLELIGEQDNPICPEFAVVAGNRLVFGSPDAQHDSTVFWGDIFDQSGPDAWRTVGPDAVNTRGFVIGTSPEGGLNALWAASIAPDASEQKAAIYAFKQATMYMLLGEPGQSVDLVPETITGTLQITRINVDAGCIAPASIVQTPQGILWCGVDDIWLMSMGSMPARIGTNLRPAIQANPPSLQYKMHAAYHDGAYKLAMFEPGQGPTGNSACHDQWWLDLRGDGIPNAESARWFGPQRYVPAHAVDTGTYALLVNQLPGQDPILLSPQLAQLEQVALGPEYPEAQIPVIVQFEAFANADTVFPYGEYTLWEASTAYEAGALLAPPGYGGRQVQNITAGTSGSGAEPIWADIDATTPFVVDGTCIWFPVVEPVIGGGPSAEQPLNYLPAAMQTGHILFDWRSREFSEPDPSKEKLLDGCNVVYQTDQPIVAEMSLLPDLEQSTVIALVNDEPQLGDSFPMQLGPKWIAKFLPPDSTKRSRALTFQVQLIQQPAITIPWESRYITIVYNYLPNILFWSSVPLGGAPEDVINGETSISPLAASSIVGTYDVDPTHAPLTYNSLSDFRVAINTALQSFGIDASVDVNLNIYGLPALSAWQFRYINGVLPEIGVPFDASGVNSYTGAVSYQTQYICHVTQADAQAAVFAGNSLIFGGFLGLEGPIPAGPATGAGFCVEDPGVVDAIHAPQGFNTAIPVFKEFGPRVRVFKRNPT